MYRNLKLAVISPALNEEKNIVPLISSIPAYVDTIIVCDNGSKDNTLGLLRELSSSYPLIPLREKQRGYGAACLRAMEELKDEDVVVFLDADLSDDPTLMHHLLDPIASGDRDFVLSNRFNPETERGAMTLPQRLGNKLSVFLIRLIWVRHLTGCHLADRHLANRRGACWRQKGPHSGGRRPSQVYHDLGPYRAIRRSALEKLGMEDRNYGWTVEMQIRAVLHGLSIAETPLPYYRRKKGKSKVSSTVRGIVRAGSKILFVIFKLAIFRK